MDPIHKKVLANKTSEIMKRISNPVFLSAHLKTIFSTGDLEEIEAKTSQCGAITGTQTMLSLLEKRGPKAFTLFVHALLDPAISCADLADDLEQEERKLRGEADMDSLVLVKLLKMEYTRRSHVRPLLWDSTIQLPIEQVYTRLKIVSSGKLASQIKDDDRNVFDIFKVPDRSEDVMTIVEGSPGIGKTTFCLKLAYDWAYGNIPSECSFPTFEFVFLLKCRDIHGDIMEAISEQLLPRDMEKSVEKHLMKNIHNQERLILMILDGLDELPEQSRHHVDELLFRRILPFCFVLATTRQERGIEVRKRVVFDIHLEIKGYTESDSIAYIRRHFETIDQSPKGKKLIEEMQQNTLLHALRNNPLNLLILCVVYEDYEGKLPTSGTELYQVIVHCLLRRYCAKRNLPAPWNDIALERKFEKEILALGELAWLCLLSDRYGFRENELDEFERKYLGLVARELGVLYKEESLKRLNPQHEYCFLHKTLQEYMAAAYIAEKLVNQGFNVFEHIPFYDLVTKYRQVFIFGSGMLGERATVLFTQIGEQLKTVFDWNWNEDCNEEEATFFIESFNESGHPEQMAGTLCNIIPLPKVITSQIVKEAFGAFFIKRKEKAVEPDKDGKDAIFSKQSSTSRSKEQLPSPSVPLDILARGSLATEVYNRELKEGFGYARRVPIMIIGQARTGKTSLKKSLKGELFDPNEGSTEGIETDPSYFKVTTDVWRTGSNSEDNETEPEFLLDREVARNIAKGLKEEERLGDPSKSKTKPSLTDVKKVERSEANSPPTERSVQSGSNRIEPSLQDSKVVENAKAPPLPTEVSVAPEEPKISSSITEPSEDDLSPKDSRDHPRVPENVAAWVEKLLKENKEFMEGDDMYSVIWDFGGQSVFYDTHPIFLTEKAIYILACNLSCDPDNKADTPVKQGRYKEIPDNYCENTNFDYLDFWMSSIYSLVSNNTNRQETSSSKKLPAVFLACTHADKPYTTKGNPSKEIFGALREKIYGSLIEDFFVVDNTKSGSSDECEGVKNLRQAVLSVAKELPQMKVPIPLKWLRYEKVLYLLMREEGLARISIKDARKIASDKCGIDDDEIFRTVLDFLHDQKVLINFDESPGLESMIILNPQWLVDVFKEVITFKGFNHKDQSVQRLWSEFENNGILERKLLDRVWRRFNDDQVTCKSLIAIMERFNLLCRWPSEGTKEQYLVPSMLRSPPTDDVLTLLASRRIPSLFVRFESCRVPPGLFSRLILLFHHWVQDKSKRPKIPKLFNNFALFHIFPHDAISVILLCHSSSIEIVFHVADVTRAEEEAFIHERYLNASRDIHRQLRLFLEYMRKEFFWLKHMRYETCISCPVCSLQTEGSKCRDHGVRSCDCLHLLSELELQEYPYCDRNVVCADCRIHKEMFVHWFAFSDVQESRIALTQREDGTGRNQSGKNFAVSTRETASKRSLTVPPEVTINQLKNQDLPKSVTHFDDCQLPVDILLLTVEDCEFLSCLSYLNPGFFKTVHDDLGFVYLGAMGEDERKLSIAVMNCYRGSASPGGSMIVVLNAVNVLRPKAVFCVGSCRSLDYDKVKLGDIVMLEKLITYGPCKITEGGIEERGFKVPLKSGLLKVKLRAGDGWKPPLKDPKALEVKIHHGTILSGPVEVIDSPKHCKALIERFPEAVAMEEESEGVFAAAHGLDIEWILIKGISDYAGCSESKETSWRPFASLMAASVTAHILSDAIIFQDWPHFKSTSFGRCRNCESRMKTDAQIPWGKEKNKEDNSGMMSCNQLRQKESDTQPPQGAVIYDALQEIYKMEAYRDAGKTDPMLNMQKIAYKRGFVISDNQGEGDCMFFAISEQLELIQGVKLSHKQLRKKVVRYLKENPTLPDGTELFHFVEGHPSWDAYLQSMKANGTWGDHVILHGAAKCFDTCIHVISSHHRDVLINPQREDVDGNRLVLGHLCELHYVSLIPRKSPEGGVKKKKHKSGAKRCKQ